VESSEFQHSIQNEQNMEQMLHEGIYFLIEKVKNKHRWEIRKSIQNSERNNPVCIESLTREFEIGSQLQHPSICSYYQLFRSENVLYREYIDGLTWNDFFEIYKDEVFRIEKYILQFLDAVQYMHSKGIFHMDLKSTNILISNEFKLIKLIDFGHAVYHNDTLYRGGVLSTTTSEKLISATQDWVAFFSIIQSNKSNFSRKINRKIDQSYRLFLENKNHLDFQKTKAIFESESKFGIRTKLIVSACSTLCALLLFIHLYNKEYIKMPKQKGNPALSIQSRNPSQKMLESNKEQKILTKYSKKKVHENISVDDSMFFVNRASLFGPEFEMKLNSGYSTEKYQLFDSLVREYDANFYQLSKLRHLDSSKVIAAKKIYTYQLSKSINNYVHLLK
jgi:serine/threonine protein kinase